MNFYHRIISVDARIVKALYFLIAPKFGMDRRNKTHTQHDLVCKTDIK